MVAPVRCATPGTDVVCAKHPLASPRSTIQSASTPPPSPPIARIAILIGSERIPLPRLRIAPLQPPDHRAAHTLAQAVPAGRVAHDLRAVERRAQHGGMRHLAAQTAADAREIGRASGR